MMFLIRVTTDGAIATAENVSAESLPKYLAAWGEIEQYADEPSFRERLAVLQKSNALDLEPDWETFRIRAVIASLPITSFSAQTLALNPTLVWLLGNVGSDPAVLPQIAQIWGAMVGIAEPSPEVVAELNAIALETHVPLKLDDSGLMTAV